MTQPSPRYTVERVETVPLPGPGGRVDYATRIHYLLPNGYAGMVVIAKREPTPEEAKAALDADVVRVRAIYGL